MKEKVVGSRKIMRIGKTGPWLFFFYTKVLNIKASRESLSDTGMMIRT